MRLTFLFLLLLFPLDSSKASEKAAWPPEVLPFFETLTSPHKEWNEKDFGSEANEEEQNLLERYHPRIFIGPKGLPPIDFYKDYLPYTVLKNEKGKVVKESPSRSELKEVERDPRYYLDFEGDFAPCRGKKCQNKKAPLYGRVFYEDLRSWSPDQKEVRPIIVLKYTAVFSQSGLPDHIGFIKTTGAILAGGTLNNWHELDIHGAIQIILDASSQQPLAVLLAQHNHFRSFIVGTDVEFPEDDRLPICFAQRSNEPYLCPEEKKPVSYRTVGDPSQADYIFKTRGEPLQGGKDVVFGPNARGVEIRTEVLFLPHLDPLYVSWIPLGDKKKILGLFDSFSRTGPPGINMNTHPALKRYGDIAQFWYFEPGDKTGMKIFNEAFPSFFQLNEKPILNYNSPRFWKNLP